MLRGQDYFFVVVVVLEDATGGGWSKLYTVVMATGAGSLGFAACFR